MSAPPPPDGSPGGPPKTPEPAPRASATGTPSPAESPQLERHQVRVGSVEPVSPSLARRPDGSLLRAERSPTPNGSGGGGRGSATAPRNGQGQSESVSVTSFAGAPRWAHRAEAWAPGARTSAGGDPQSKRSSQFDLHIHELRGE